MDKELKPRPWYLIHILCQEINQRCPIWLTVFSNVSLVFHTDATDVARLSNWHGFEKQFQGSWVHANRGTYDVLRVDPLVSHLRRWFTNEQLSYSGELQNRRSRRRMRTAHFNAWFFATIVHNALYFPGCIKHSSFFYTEDDVHPKLVTVFQL